MRKRGEQLWRDIGVCFEFANLCGELEFDTPTTVGVGSPDFKLHIAARKRGADDRGNRFVGPDFLTIRTRDDIAVLESRAQRRTCIGDATDHHTFAFEIIRHHCKHALLRPLPKAFERRHLHAEVALAHFAVLDELRDGRLDHRHRDRQTNTCELTLANTVAATCGDCRVHADHATANISEWSA